MDDGEPSGDGERALASRERREGRRKTQTSFHRRIRISSEDIRTHAYVLLPAWLPWTKWVSLIDIICVHRHGHRPSSLGSAVPQPHHGIVKRSPRHAVGRFPFSGTTEPQASCPLRSKPPRQCPGGPRAWNCSSMPYAGAVSPERTWASLSSRRGVSWCRGRRGVYMLMSRADEATVHHSVL